MTTVGYGDTPVTTTGGRIIAVALMATGIGFVAVLTAAAAERFMHTRREQERAVEERFDQIITTSTLWNIVSFGPCARRRVRVAREAAVAPRASRRAAQPVQRR